MANKTIPQLPSQSAATDLDLLVIVNSGETTTSKITRADLLSGVIPTVLYKSGTGTDSIIPTYLSTSSVTSGTKNTISSGVNNTITSSGNNNIISGGDSNSITNGTGSAIVGGFSHLSSAEYNVLGGYDNTNSGGYGAVFGYRNSITGGSGLAFGNNNNLGGAYGFIYGNANTVQGGNDIGSTIMGGSSQVIAANGGHGIVIVGGSNNIFRIGGGATDDTLRSYSTMLGGFGNKLADDAGTGSGKAGYALIGGKSNTVKATTPTLFPTTLATSGSTIQGGSTRAVVIGGINNIVDTKTDAMILASSGRTALYDYTVHADNTHTYKVESFNIVNGGNVGGSINVDCTAGTIFTFTLTGDTTPNFVNPRVGQRFIFIVYNTTFNVPTATVNGVAGTVFAKNGTISPSNNGYSKYTATYDGTYLFLDEELGFSAV